jgi:UDPglucose 6-dehydrogenase
VPQVEMCAFGEAVAEGADAVVIATEWQEFKTLDWEKMKKQMISPLIFDGRNLLDPAGMRALGYQYHSIGR